MEQNSFFPDERQSVTDEEVVEVLRTAIARSGRLSRMADLVLSSICAEHLVDELHLADFDVVRRPSPRFRD